MPFTSFVTPHRHTDACPPPRQLTLRVALTAVALTLGTYSTGVRADSLPNTAPTEPSTAAVRSGIEPQAERLVHQDSGSRIEELRVGGQTRSIEVQTPSKLPGYEVQPIDPSQSSDAPGSEGKSRWRLLRF